jgi:hypothetical protein
MASQGPKGEAQTRLCLGYALEQKHCHYHYYHYHYYHYHYYQHYHYHYYALEQKHYYYHYYAIVFGLLALPLPLLPLLLLLLLSLIRSHLGCNSTIWLVLFLSCSIHCSHSFPASYHGSDRYR